MDINQSWKKNPEKHNTTNWIEKPPYYKGSPRTTKLQFGKDKYLKLWFSNEGNFILQGTRGDIYWLSDGEGGCYWYLWG